MKNIKRILIGIIVLLVIMNLFNLLVNLLQEKQYKYLTRDNEWGYSNNCYLDENQFAICNLDGELVIVRQFYEV